MVRNPKYIIQPKRTPEDLEQTLRSVILMIKSLPDHMGWQIEISKPKKEGSNQQYRALYGCAYKFISDETGNDAEDLHTMFCGEFFGWKEESVMGSTKRKPIRTTTKDEEGYTDRIDTAKLVEFYDFVQMYTAKQTGIAVPDPDPDWKERMLEEDRIKQAKNKAP